MLRRVTRGALWASIITQALLGLDAWLLLVSVVPTVGALWRGRRALEGRVVNAAPHLSLALVTGAVPVVVGLFLAAPDLVVVGGLSYATIVALWVLLHRLVAVQTRETALRHRLEAAERRRLAEQQARAQDRGGAGSA